MVDGVAEIGPQRFDRAVVWAAVSVGVLALAIVWVVGTGMRPGYDPFGWLAWGHAALRLDLDTDGAPSWKPLTFLFAVLYALPGHASQMWLWMITSAAGAVLGLLFAARIAMRLASEQPLWARVAAAAVAVFAVLGIKDYVPLALVADSDPLIVALCLGAIDRHLAGRPRAAFATLLLAAFGRPEAAPFACGYAIWLWRTVPSLRVTAALGMALIPVAWFGVPTITSHSWFIAGDTALGSPHQVHGDVIGGVLARFFGLCGWPIRAVWAIVVVLALIRRDRIQIALLATVVLWIAVEIVFAAGGWSAVPRYLIEPAAVLIVLAAAGVGHTLAYQPKAGGLLARTAPTLLVLALVLALAPAARSRAQTTHGELHAAHAAALALTRLQAVIASDGGAAVIKSCGQPVTLVGKQSEVAWATGLNVGNVGYRPGKSIDQGTPIILIKPHNDGWQIRPFHIPTPDTARCQKLKTNSTFGANG